MFFHTPPDDFQPKLEAAGLYCVWNEKILFLKRHPSRSYGNTWSVPGGKLEQGETPEEAIIREIYEEIGLKIEQPKNLGKIFTRLPEYDYIFHIFCHTFSEMPKIQLNDEHLESKWLNIDEGFTLPLIMGGKEGLLFFQNFLYKK